jgi:hypothetical protein
LADKNPAIAGLAEDASGVILANVGVCCNKGRGGFFGAVSGGRKGRGGTFSIFETKNLEGRIA